MSKLIFLFIFLYAIWSILRGVIKIFLLAKKKSNKQNSLKEKDISNQAEIINEKRLDREDK